MLQLWRHALAPEPRVARQGLESGHTLTVCGLLGTLAQNKLVSLNPSRGRLQAQRADLFYEVTYGEPVPTSPLLLVKISECII